MIGLPTSEPESDPASYKPPESCLLGVLKDSPFSGSPPQAAWESGPGQPETGWVQCGAEEKGLLASVSHSCCLPGLRAGPHCWARSPREPWRRLASRPHSQPSGPLPPGGVRRLQCPWRRPCPWCPAWTTAGHTASASCCADMATCMQAAAARQVRASLEPLTLLSLTSQPCAFLQEPSSLPRLRAPSPSKGRRLLSTPATSPRQKGTPRDGTAS